MECPINAMKDAVKKRKKKPIVIANEYEKSYDKERKKTSWAMNQTDSGHEANLQFQLPFDEIKFLHQWSAQSIQLKTQLESD